MVREGKPSTETIVMLALLLTAAVTDLMLAIVFVFIPLPGGKPELWVHVATIVMDAIIISITAVLLKEDMDSVFSTVTIYLVLSGISTVANFGISVRSLRCSMGEVRPLQPFKLSWLRMSGSTQVAPEYSALGPGVHATSCSPSEESKDSSLEGSQLTVVAWDYCGSNGGGCSAAVSSGRSVYRPITDQTSVRWPLERVAAIRI